MTKNNILPLLALFLLHALLFSCKFGSYAAGKTVSAPTKPAAYGEPHRPQFHFTPEKMWMNDPNGMVFYAGEYHLFYQYYPGSNVWGPMHWGHAISRDLVHWEHLPIALYPDSLGYIFSGSAVVDGHNTTGFGQNGQPPLVAMFTYHDMAAEKAGRSDYESQGIAFSNDRGRTWTKYAGNPVIPNPGKTPDFRDPKVVWDESFRQWIVVLAVGDHAEFWGSSNLKKWTHLSDFGKTYGAHDGVWECPDFFQITVESTGEKKWALIQNLNPGSPNGGSGAQYFVGTFDGKQFTLDPGFVPAVSNGKAVWIDYGRDNYAGVTWSDVPASDGRRLFLGWMSNWDYALAVPTTAWRSATTVARTLTLHRTAEGYRLYTQPVRELESLRGKSHEITATTLAVPLDLTGALGFSPALSEMDLEFELPAGAAGQVGVELSNSRNERYRIGYDAGSRQFFSDRTQAGDAAFSQKFAARVHVAPRVSREKTIRFHLFFDVASAELFADQGETVLTDIFFPSEDFSHVTLFADGGTTKLIKGKIYQLNRIWR